MKNDCQRGLNLPQIYQPRSGLQQPKGLFYSLQLRRICFQNGYFFLPRVLSPGNFEPSLWNLQQFGKKPDTGLIGLAFHRRCLQADLEPPLKRDHFVSGTSRLNTNRKRIVHIFNGFFTIILDTRPVPQGS